MATLALILAGYAAYQKYEQSKQARYDDTIQLEGKASIQLLPAEQELAVLQYPICTVSFFEGNADAVASHLESRVNDILRLNPWLSGWLIRDASDDYRVKIFYDETLSDRCRGHHFELCKEPVVSLPVSQKKSDVQAFEAFLKEASLIVPSNLELIGRDRPLWKVTVVKERDSGDADATTSTPKKRRFALVVSMSHAAGDAHTYYQLLRMLDVDSPVAELDPVRKFNYKDELQSMMLPSEKGAADERRREDMDDYLARAMKHPLVDLSGIGGGSGSRIGDEDDSIVMKSFFVHGDWVVDRKAARQSVFAPEPVGKRGDRDGADISPDASSGRKDKIATVVSVSSMLTSWFFVLNDASIGLQSVNLRNRIDGCELNDSSAGNYVTHIGYTPDDYRTPGRVQHSLRRLSRCGPNSPPELPALSWVTTCSLSNDWSRLFRDELYLHDDVSMMLHMPLWNIEFLASLPSRFSALHTFTALPEGIDGRERRLGALVLCRRSVWNKILESGVVEEMIVDF
jgi:hypothetical protein